MNIYQRVNEVRREIAYVKKDAAVQGYRAVTHDMVTASVRDSLIKHGIVIVPTQIDGKMLEAGTTSKGNQIYRYEASYQVAFINMDDPADMICVSLEAHANDSSDKAPGKCCSYAVKYAMLKLFSIETGENEESRMEGNRKEEALIEHLKSEVAEYIESNDSLAVYLVSQRVGHDVWTDVYNSAPAGQKTAFKKTLGTMEVQGGDIMKAINTAILTEDAGAAAENIHDITPGCKRLLAEKLGHEKAASLGSLVASIQS